MPTRRMVLNLTSVQSSRLLDLGIGISDLGFCPLTNPKSAIPIPKSRLRLRGQCRLLTGFLLHTIVDDSFVVRGSSFVVRLRPELVRRHRTNDGSTNHEQRTTLNKQLLLLPSRLPDSHPAALVRHKLQQDFLSSGHQPSGRSHIPFPISAGRSRRQTRSQDSDHA